MIKQGYFFRYIIPRIVIILSLFFIGSSFVKSISHGEFQWGTEVIPIIAVGGIAYYITLQMLIVSWYYLINKSGETKASFNICYSIYGKSQIAKYLPGNIFHYAGRHVMGRRQDWSNSTLLTSIFMETGGLVVASVSVLFIGLLLNLNMINVGINLSQKVYLSLIMGILILFLPYLFIQLIKKVEWKENKLKELKSIFVSNNIKWLSYMSIPIIFYILFFAFNGLIIYFIALYNFISFSGLAEVGYFMGCLSLSWLIGFITPGAPGGLGVRETIMMTTLSEMMSNTQALEVALLFRAITIVGDSILYFSTLVFKQGSKLSADKH